MGWNGSDTVTSLFSNISTGKQHFPKIYLCRASDNSRGKKSNFAGFLETNLQKKWPISQEFFAEKQRKKPRRKIPEKRYIGRMSNSGQERRHKSSSNTVLKAIVLVLSYKKNI